MTSKEFQSFQLLMETVGGSYFADGKNSEKVTEDNFKKTVDSFSTSKTGKQIKIANLCGAAKQIEALKLIAGLEMPTKVKIAVASNMLKIETSKQPVKRFL